MATVNPQEVFDRSSIPYYTRWFDSNEGASGTWLPIGVVRGFNFSPSTDSVDAEQGLEQYDEKTRTPGGANTFTVDMDMGIGDGVLESMQAVKDSGGNTHQLRLLQRGVKRNGVTLSSSKKFKVEKTHATGGAGLGDVTLTGITLEDLGGFINKGMAFALNSAAPALTNLFVIQSVDYTKDVGDKGFIQVYEYSLTTGLKDADPTLAEVTAGTLDYIFPDARVDINASLDQDIRGNVSPGQSVRGSIQFSESGAPIYRLGNVGVYATQDAMI